MNKRQIAVAVIVLLAALFAGRTLAQGPALPPGEYDLEAGQYVFNVPELASTATEPVATDTPIPPTDTPEPTVTDTPFPTDTLEPSEHNDREWHPLTEAFGHEHKEDPHSVDDIFGVQFYGWAGGGVSYPWQTPNENANKHEGYGWLVNVDESCFAQYAAICVKAYRVQYHAIMGSLGATVRYHSYWMELLICRESDPDNCGILRGGGWHDFGCLFVDDVHVPLPSDPSTCGNNRRLHNSGPPKPKIATWYGATVGGFTDLAIRGEDVWGPVDPLDPFKLQFYCPDYQCALNNSRMTMHILAGSIGGFDDPDGDGYVDFNGYRNRYGQIVSGCSEVGLDCIPFVLEHVPTGYYQRRNNASDTVEADISPAGEWWIKYPN